MLLQKSICRISIVLAGLVGFGIATLRAEPLPAAAFDPVKDYTYSCWAYGWRDASRVFTMQTSHYGLAFDYNDFNLLALGPIPKPVSEGEALTQRTEALLDSLSPTLFSDSFDAGAAGQGLGGAAMDNRLGGRLATNWIAPSGQTPAYLATAQGLEAQAAYDCTLADAAIDPARGYSLSARVNPPDGMDGTFHTFSGLAFKVRAEAPEFWAESGAILRIFNNGDLDIKYGRTGGGLGFVTAGTFHPAADYDAEGRLLVRLEFSGAGTPGSPLVVRTFVNERPCGTASITDLAAGDRVGFAAPYGGQFDDVVLRDITQQPSLTARIVSSGTPYAVTSGDSDPIHCHLVETGKFFQRRYLRNLNFAAGAPALSDPFTGLEFAAWPDRLAIVLRARPTAALANAALQLQLDLPDAYFNYYASGSARALLDSSGAGYILLPDGPGTTLSIVNSPVRASVSIPAAAWSANSDRSVGLVIYFVAANGQARLAEIAAAEAAPPTVTARQLAPLAANLTTSYNAQLGWHQVNLRDDGPSGPPHDRIERVALSITNPSAQMRTVRLNFAKGPGVYGVTGVSAMLRDAELYPTGIPVQHSKNWHATPGSPERYEGGWWRGLTMLAVPPQTTLELEYDTVNAHWGGLPAASHAQLSLVGYGGNQQWDEAAMGSWGESICFDPDVNLNRSMIDDVRPLLVTSLVNSQYEWTNNLGGGDFLLYFNGAGQRQRNNRMKTRFRRSSPNLTEVTYAGSSADNRIDLSCSASLFRSDDYLRVLYHLRYDVKAPVSFSRLAFLQVAADNYSDGRVNRMAYGNADGLTEEWTPTRGGLNYSRSRVALPGRKPWISMHELELPGAVGASGNRALVVEAWDARLNGTPSPTPHFSVYGSNNGIASAIAELSAPPGVTTLQPGDYVDAWVTHLILPQYAADYYGPNANLAAALAQPGFENSWRLLQREAERNALAVSADVGTVEREKTPRIRSDGNRAEFSITGGLAHTPVTISGLTRYHDPMLFTRVDNGPWTQVDQARHGNDYWQMDYDATDGTWEVTYNVDSDTPGDARTTRDYVFQFAPYVAAELSALTAD